jgi:hypothetical protein
VLLQAGDVSALSSPASSFFSFLFFSSLQSLYIVVLSHRPHNISTSL